MAIGSLFFELVCVNVGVRGVCRGVQGTMSDEGENSQMLNVAISLFLCTREVICLILLARLLYCTGKIQRFAYIHTI